MVRMYLTIAHELIVLLFIFEVDQFEKAAPLEPVRQNFLSGLLHTTLRIAQVVNDEGLAVNVEDASHAE